MGGGGGGECTPLVLGGGEVDGVLGHHLEIQPASLPRA